MKVKRKKTLKKVKFIPEFLAQAELDYHKLGILNHYEIEKILTEFIEDSYVKGLTKILVITGKGEVVRPLCQKLLAANKYVQNYKQASYYNGQSGAFEVILKD